MSDASSLPRSIGGYPVEGLVGVGGMGRVYACRDDALGRTVALKRLTPELAKNPEMCARFLREARAMARINSSHVVTVFGVGEEGGVPFFVMELLTGEDLSARVKRKGPERPALAIQHITDAVDGLQAALEAGIIHRDVKPANLFLVGDQVKLTDFGLALPLESGASPRLTQAGLVVGTPHYIAPEVARGVEATVQSDMYSLGASLFEMLTGHPPYEAEASVDVISMHLNDPVPDLKKELPEAPAALIKLVKRLMAKEPKDRFADYQKLREELHDISSQFTQVQNLARRGPRITPSMPRHVDEIEAAASRRQQQAGGSRNPTLPPAGIPVPRLSEPGIKAVKTATQSVMVVDVIGYAERTGQPSREEAAWWVKLHEQLLGPCFKGFGGKVVKTTGDAFLVVFSSPTDAVLCGLALQDRLWFHNQVARAEDLVEARVAISAGEVRTHRGDIFGEPVNLATRLEALAHAGEVLLSDAVYATMDTGEAALELRGEHTFKGINRPVKVYVAVPEGIEGQPPFGAVALARVPSFWMRLKGNLAEGLRSLKGGRLPGSGARNAFVFGLAAAAILVGVGIGLAATVLSKDPRIARIDDGGAEVVLRDIAAIPVEQRKGVDDLVKGHAYFALGKPKLGIRAYKSAVEKEVWDDRALDHAFALLKERNTQGAIGLLTEWPNEDIIPRLLDGLSDDDWYLRHNALKTLDAREAATSAHRVKVALADLEKGNSCRGREKGVDVLAEIGRGERVLEALKQASVEAEKNFCMTDKLAAALDAVKTRTEGGDVAEAPAEEDNGKKPPGKKSDKKT